MARKAKMMIPHLLYDDTKALVEILESLNKKNALSDSQKDVISKAKDSLTKVWATVNAERPDFLYFPNFLDVDEFGYMYDFRGKDGEHYAMYVNVSSDVNKHKSILVRELHEELTDKSTARAFVLNRLADAYNFHQEVLAEETSLSSN